MSASTDILNAAERLHAAHLAVIPVATDGTKRPAVQWKEFQQQGPTLEHLRDWFTPGRFDGLGVITGRVSGNLEMLEVEGRALDLLEQLTDLMSGHGLGPLWDRLTQGYVEQSPSGGVHWLYRVDGPAMPNTKLARRPMSQLELENVKHQERARAHEKLASDPDWLQRRLAVVDALTGADRPEVLIETRGEGGYTVTAPSNGRTHATGGAWSVLVGGPETIPTISADERDALYAVAALLDEMPRPTPRVAAQPAPSAPTGSAPTVAAFMAGDLDRPAVGAPGERPGDAFNQQVTWDEVLVPHGWQRRRHVGGIEWEWTRPGKDVLQGPSATTGRNDADNLYVFTTSTLFAAEKPYDKFAAYVLLEHAGDFSAGARALRAQGYGADLQAAAVPVATVPQGVVQKPPLNVGNAADMADWLRTNVGRGPLAGMFLRGHDIVHTPCEGEDGYAPLRGDDQDDDGPAQVRVIRKSTLASRVQYAYACHKVVKRGSEQVSVPAMFPVDAARVATDVPEELTGLRRLRGVVHSPVFRPDGSILASPGYDQATGILHLPERGLVVPPVSDAPTPGEVAQAMGLLDEMTAGFNFVTEHDRANYYGILLTPLLRAMTPPPYKLAAISSPQPGSGKTLLASVARIIHGGIFRSELPEDDAELRKQITALLTVTTGPIVHFDNVSGVLRSSTMAGLLTSSTWGDRPLGATEWIGTPNDRLWMVTGNNLYLGGDLIRRTLWVTIDPGVPNPERRTGFAIADLERWASQRRGDLLHALLTLVRAWVVDGRPGMTARSSDGYSTWTQTIAAILAHAGACGTFDDPASAQQALGADDDEWADFLAAVHDVMGDQEWSVKRLLSLVDTAMHTLSHLPTAGNDRPLKLATFPAELMDKANRGGLQSVARSLGMWLRNRAGRWAGDHTVRFVREGSARERFWRVERNSGLSTVTTVTATPPSGDSGDTSDSSSNPDARDQLSLLCVGGRNNVTTVTAVTGPGAAQGVTQ